MNITKTLRQYVNVTTQELVEHFDLFNLVEKLVDDYCGVKLDGTISGRAYYPKTEGDKIFTNFELSGQTLTLTDKTFDKNTFQFCIVEPLEGNSTNLIPVIKSDNNVLTLAVNTTPNFTACEIYQLGNFPRYADHTGDFKKIPQDIKQASFYLAKYLLENKKVLDSITLQSETQSTNSYSYELGEGGNQANLTFPPYIASLLDKYKY